jgi:hypothetical protein
MVVTHRKVSSEESLLPKAFDTSAISSTNRSAEKIASLGSYTP